ncbi:hypothetical protein [Streptomyces odonnellii]|nr:hypothetical protein [Streptomyces odonnellii]
MSRSDQGWGVYLTDREPDQAPPARLSFTALAHSATYRQAA